MLSRTAENLFWMARYMERAEATARLLTMGQRMAILPGAHHRDGHRLPKTRAERRRRCSLSVPHSSPHVYRRRGVVGVNARPYHDTHLILRGLLRGELAV